MPKINEYGLELARANLPHIAAQAQAGYSSVLTRHGKAVAMVVPVSFWEQQRKRQTKARSILSLRGAGRSIWPQDAARSVAQLRDEWP